MSKLKKFVQSALIENAYKIRYSKSTGVDGINGEKFLDHSDELKIIGRKLDAECYKLSNYKENLIIKKHNSTRQISIPTQRDKLVLQGLLKALKKDFPIYNTSAKSKIIDIKNNRHHYDSYIKIDIENFFPTIDHKKLLPLIKTKASEEVFNLIKLAITQPTISIDTPKNERDIRISNIGIPQGLPISSFLSDIFLQKIDQKFEKNSKIKYYRFVDDILILCKTLDIDTLIENIESSFLDLDLKVHKQSTNKDKSSHGDIADGFQYLGYNFTANIVSVRQSSVQKLYSNINKLFIVYGYRKNKIKKEDGAKKKDLIENLIYSLNEKIAGAKYDDKKYGWINYFSEINNQTLLFKIDSHVKRMASKYFDNNDLEFLTSNNLRIKKFSKAIFEIRKKDSNYVEKPDISSLKRMLKNFSKEENVEKKTNKGLEKIEKLKSQSNSIQLPKEVSKKINTSDFRNPEKTIASLRSDVEPY